MKNTISVHNNNDCGELIYGNSGLNGSLKYYSKEYIITGERWLQWIN